MNTLAIVVLVVAVDVVMDTVDGTPIGQPGKSSLSPPAPTESAAGRGSTTGTRDKVAATISAAADELDDHFPTAGPADGLTPPSTPVRPASADGIPQHETVKATAADDHKKTANRMLNKLFSQLVRFY